MERPITPISLLLFPPMAILVMSLALSFGGFIVLAADRGEPVRFSARILSLYVREALARSLIFSMSPLGWYNPGPKAWSVGYSGEEVRRVPVLLLPGYGTNRAALAFLCVFLARRGWRWLWPVSWSRRDRSLADHAVELGERVERLQRATGAQRIDIVAYSMGGLVAAWYLRHLGGDARVRRLVTIGTPWKGTKLAVFGTAPSSREMLFGAHVLDALTPPPVPTLCVWSPDDPIVVPATSASPEGMRSVRIETAGHYDMLLSARVYRAVQAALSHPLSQRP